ncbi:flagellar assembly protein FliH [Fictibacillus aquaticus]|uniref:Flagellar assembly protein FliH n=1 Tax=Fictibacillus aquaticus TaxID=2021314 RepID=A0A235FBZ0_9BACL|nr:flagellar assembly protein FliH [Fictibacillus aquaticus]OYD58858.1 flagellar assembly protein FliH [Fictibacillus aquaticus]
MSNIIKQSFVSDNCLSNNNVIIGIKPIDLDQELDVIELTADELLQRNRAEAEQVRRAAYEEAEKLKKSMLQEYENHKEMLAQLESELRLKMAAETEASKSEGYEKGFKEGLASGLEQWKVRIQEAEKIVSLSQDAYNKHLESAEGVIIEMATAVAGKVTGIALKEDEAVWVSTVKQLIREVRETGEVKLYVHPDWYETTMTYRDEMKNMLLGTSALYVFPDSSLKEFGCVIESHFGKVDATLDSQLSEIKTILLERLEGASSESR